MGNKQLTIDKKPTNNIIGVNTPNESIDISKHMTIEEFHDFYATKLNVKPAQLQLHITNNNINLMQGYEHTSVNAYPYITVTLSPADAVRSVTIIDQKGKETIIDVHPGMTVYMIQVVYFKLNALKVYEFNEMFMANGRNLLCYDDVYIADYTTIEVKPKFRITHYYYQWDFNGHDLTVGQGTTVKEFKRCYEAKYKSKYNLSVYTRDGHCWSDDDDITAGWDVSEIITVGNGPPPKK